MINGALQLSKVSFAMRNQSLLHRFDKNKVMLMKSFISSTAQVNADIFFNQILTQSDLGGQRLYGTRMSRLGHKMPEKEQKNVSTL
jgi:hypothetical protein